MPATLRLREQDQTAELHELLSRLQTSKVDEFGGIMDIIRREREGLKDAFPDRQRVLEKCQVLLIATGIESARALLINSYLIKFMEKFKKIEDKHENNDNETMTQVAIEWRHLKFELRAYANESNPYFEEKRKSRNVSKGRPPPVSERDAADVNSAGKRLQNVMHNYIGRSGKKLKEEWW